MPNHDSSAVTWIRSRIDLMDQIDDVPRPRVEEAGANNPINEHRKKGRQNWNTKLEDLSLKTLLIRSFAGTHESNGLLNDGRVEEVTTGRLDNERRRLTRDIIESRGMGGEGEEVEGGGRGGATGEQSKPEELRVTG